MKYVDRAGNPLDDREWYAMTGRFGMGVVLSETTLPHVLGEITLRTVFVGVAEDEPDERPYTQAVLPYRTLRRVHGRGGWETLQTYHGEAQARAGHIQWCMRVANEAADEVTR